MTTAAQKQNPVAEPTATPTSLELVDLPRISIKFCTQCRWMLRAAYVRIPISPYNIELTPNTN